MLAVEMSALPPCATGPLLNPDPAPICAGSTTIFSEDWETGGDAGAAARGWTKTSTGFATGLVDWETQPSKNNTRFFHVVGSLPAGRAGSAAFAVDPPVGQEGGGTCAPGGDFSGSHTLDSPLITIPAGVTAAQLSFDHWIASEAGVDGGQVEISRNGGAYQLLPKAACVYNAPNVAFNQAAPVGNNTGPNPSEDAWTGTNLGSAIQGSWGTTLIDLSSVAQPNDTIRIRFTWSQDGCNGIVGWYVDNVRVFSCPVLQAPTLSTGGDYENPDTDGKFTLNWIRPATAIGPDVLQESRTSCAPLLFDNAESGMGNWLTSTTGTGAQPWKADNSKPQRTGNTFNVQGVNAITNADSYLTYKFPISIPAGGQTYLNFLDWDNNEGDDNVLIEVSEDNGATWTSIYLHNRSELGTGAVSFATEPLFAHSINLANYGGKTIRLRFHYSLGAEDRAGSAPFGWYVDDISLVNDNWVDVANTALTSSTQTRPSGTYCYRVRTTFNLGGQPAAGPFSSPLTVTVAPGIASVVSRKVHGGTHDIPMPFTGTPGVECRLGSGANNGSHQLVFQFGAPATFTGAAVTPAAGKTAQVDSTATSGNEVIVNLKNVTDGQIVNLQLLNANDGSGAHTISVPVGFLVGDTNGDHTVNSGDSQQTRNAAGQAPGATNFRTDVNVDNAINSGDSTIVRSHAGNGTGL